MCKRFLEKFSGLNIYTPVAYHSGVITGTLNSVKNDVIKMSISGHEPI